MVHAWGGYANGQIPTSAMVQVQGEWFEPDMGARMAYLLSKLPIHINEGYRPLGVESDQYVTNESQTASGRSTQWFQWGRYKRGETPLANWPPSGTASHGWGLAADINPGRGHADVEALCAQLGLIFTVASENWHVAADGVPTIAYKGPDPLQLLHDLQQKEEDEMRIIQVAGVRYLLGNQYVAKFVPNPFNDGKPENTTNGILTALYENDGATNRPVYQTGSPVKGETAALMHGVPVDAFQKVAASTTPLAWSIQRGFFDPTKLIGK